MGRTAATTIGSSLRRAPPFVCLLCANTTAQHRLCALPEALDFFFLSPPEQKEAERRKTLF
jgi:hypothetical protein